MGMIDLKRIGGNGKMRGVWMNGFPAKESTIEKTSHSENLPYPLFAKSRKTRDCLP